MSSSLNRDRHIRYFSHCLRQLPSAYSSLDTSRLTLVHFAVQALTLLGAPIPNTAGIINWIYSLQDLCGGGFEGGNALPKECQHGHIAMTYTGLCTLKTLGDDWSRVDKEKIISLLKKLQRHDGSFQCVVVGSEYDMRFLYCACAISYMLDDWSGIDVEKTLGYIQSCRSFDGALSLIPHQEGHGGSTFCGVASLALMGKLDILSRNNWKRDLRHWCVSRQVGGMQGRPNKLEDTCYSYWIGGALKLLDLHDLLDQDALCQYVMSCQHTRFGGFGKVLGANPDVLHSFYSLAWLSLSSRRYDDLGDLDCVLGVVKQEHEEEIED